MKRLAFSLIAAAFALPAMAQDVTLKFHHIWNPQAMASVNLIVPWCDKIAKESANKMKCQILPAMSGGGTPPQLVDRVKDGVDDLVITLPGYTAGRFPLMEVFELPFMTNSAEAGARAAWDYLNKNALKEFPGTKILATWVHDEGYVHTKDRQVKTLADFKGLKMRAPTRQTNKLLAALGASPVGMPLPAIPDAVSKGTIDGFLLPWEVMPSLKLQEMVKYHSLTDPSRPALYSAVFIFAMNQAKYDSLPADLKKVIDNNSGIETAAMFGHAMDEGDKIGLSLAQKAGNNIITLDAAETQRWQRAAAGVRAEWYHQVAEKGIDGPKLAAEAEALIAKYSKK
jgi:TRAP-type C4-dicarboxylate transport system substrate-binding protein